MQWPPSSFLSIGNTCNAHRIIERSTPLLDTISIVIVATEVITSYTYIRPICSVSIHSLFHYLLCLCLSFVLMCVSATMRSFSWVLSLSDVEMSRCPSREALYRTYCSILTITIQKVPRHPWRAVPWEHGSTPRYPICLVCCHILFGPYQIWTAQETVKKLIYRILVPSSNFQWGFCQYCFDKITGIRETCDRDNFYTVKWTRNVSSEFEMFYVRRTFQDNWFTITHHHVEILTG